MVWESNFKPLFVFLHFIFLVSVFFFLQWIIYYIFFSKLFVSPFRVYYHVRCWLLIRLFCWTRSTFFFSRHFSFLFGKKKILENLNSKIIWFYSIFFFKSKVKVALFGGKERERDEEEKKVVFFFNIKCDKCWIFH